MTIKYGSECAFPLYSDLSLLFLLISSIPKLGCEPETDLPGQLQWLSLARPPLPWSQPLSFVHDCMRMQQRGLGVPCCNPAVCHSPQPCLQHVPWTCIFNFVKKNNQPEGTVVFSLTLVIAQTSGCLGRSVPTARKTYQVLCAAAFLARHTTP